MTKELLLENSTILVFTVWFDKIKRWQQLDISSTFSLIHFLSENITRGCFKNVWRDMDKREITSLNQFSFVVAHSSMLNFWWAMNFISLFSPLSFWRREHFCIPVCQLDRDSDLKLLTFNSNVVSIGRTYDKWAYFVIFEKKKFAHIHVLVSVQFIFDTPNGMKTVSALRRSFMQNVLIDK